MSTGEPLALSSEEKTWGMLCHLAALTGTFTLIGFVLGPLIVWILKKDQSKYVDEQGKEAMNFQISMLIYMMVSIPLMIIAIGFITFTIAYIADIVLSIVAAIAANEGRVYKYPFTITFIK